MERESTMFSATVSDLRSKSPRTRRNDSAEIGPVVAVIRHPSSELENAVQLKMEFNAVQQYNDAFLRAYLSSRHCRTTACKDSSKQRSHQIIPRTFAQNIFQTDSSVLKIAVQ
jgi:hypothetical protein